VELKGIYIVVYCGNCREHILLCVLGIVGNKLCSELWKCREQIVLCFVEFVVKNIEVCCGNFRVQIVLGVVENVRKK